MPLLNWDMGIRLGAEPCVGLQGTRRAQAQAEGSLCTNPYGELEASLMGSLPAPQEPPPGPPHPQAVLMSDALPLLPFLGPPLQAGKSRSPSPPCEQQSL